jgi:hypothetical protein
MWGAEPGPALVAGEQEAHNAEPKPLALASQTQLSEDERLGVHQPDKPDMSQIELVSE